MLHVGEPLIQGFDVAPADSQIGALRGVAAATAHVNAGKPGTSIDVAPLACRRRREVARPQRQVLHVFADNKPRGAGAASPCGAGAVVDLRTESGPMTRDANADFDRLSGHLSLLRHKSPPPFASRGALARAGSTRTPRSSTPEVALPLGLFAVSGRTTSIGRWRVTTASWASSPPRWSATLARPRDPSLVPATPRRSITRRQHPAGCAGSAIRQQPGSDGGLAARGQWSPRRRQADRPRRCAKAEPVPLTSTDGDARLPTPMSAPTPSRRFYALAPHFACRPHSSR